MDLRIPQELVDRAVLRFEIEARKRSQEAPPRPPRVITISRQLGSGGRRVAEILGDRLGWPVWDKQILEVIAGQSSLHYQARMFEALDESTQGAIEDAMYAALGGVSKHVYLHLLPRAILIAAQNDAILLGRGAHLLLPGALKVRLEAPLETRVGNLIRFEGMAERAAREQVAATDRARTGFLREFTSALRHSGEPVEISSQYDLILNTGRFTIQGLASVILHAATQRFHLEMVEPKLSPGPVDPTRPL